MRKLRPRRCSDGPTIAQWGRHRKRKQTMCAAHKRYYTDSKSMHGSSFWRRVMMRERHVHHYLQNRALGGGVRSPECGELNTPRKLRGFLEAVTFPRDSRMEATVFHRPGTCTRGKRRGSTGSSRSNTEMWKTLLLPGDAEMDNWSLFRSGLSKWLCA